MLKGHVKLQLADGITGRIKEEIEGNNAFTDAINSLLNKAPMGCDRRTLDATQTATESVLDLATTALGGVLLFPEDVGTGLYEPLTHQPTAYSRYGAQDTSDTKSGAYSIAESIEIPNGFRFVHEWGASFGNGTIKTVCLTNKYGAEAYGSKAYFGDTWRFSMGDIGGAARYVGFCDEYFYFLDNHRALANGTRIMRIKRPRLEMLITQKAWNIANAEEVYTCDTNNSRVGISEADKKIYVLKGAASDNKTLVTIDLTTTPVTVSSSTLQNTNSIPVAPSYRYIGICKRGNYIYFGKSISGTELTITKLNISNTADTDELTATITDSTGDIYLTEDTNEIIGNGFVIDTEDTVHVTTAVARAAVAARCGVWQAYSAQSLSLTAERVPLEWQINPYYMASKFSLESAVTKTSALTMKLVYEVTHT